MQKILIIQTAFIGDVVLATALVEKLHKYFPDASIDFLVRKGNEPLLKNNPWLNEILTWDKKNNKNRNLFRLLKKIRAEKYQKVINLQRYLSTGILTAFSGAEQTIGFNKNPVSFLFSKSIKHAFDISHPRHEVEKNNDLIKTFTDDLLSKPVLYPSAEDLDAIKTYTQVPFITMTTSSVWFTKQYPVEKWIELIEQVDPRFTIYLLGGKDNFPECEFIRSKAGKNNVITLAGKLDFLRSAALMKFAVMNFTNDSGPMHFASAVNAPVTAVFCSTIPAFGYTPLSDRSFIVETKELLSCRPCGVHGRKTCPEGHFRCGYGISTAALLQNIPNPC